jgi:predicted permease
MRRRGQPRRPFWYLRRPPGVVQSDVDDELDLHLEMRAEELRSQGLSPDEARREALRQFGDLEYTRRYCREQDVQKEQGMQRGLRLEDLVQDVRICLRALGRAPMLTATIVATVGLGIGATTAIFGAVHAALLRPLPYREPGRLVRIYTDAPPYKFRFSVADYQALEAQQTRFERTAAYTERAMAFSDGAVAERVRGSEVTWTYFGVLGVAPLLGRDFTELDGRPGSPPVVIVSHGFWQRRLGGRADAIGDTVRLDGRDHALAGVLPPTVGPLEQGREFFVAAQWETPRRKGPFFYIALARLREGGDRSAASEELRTINRRLFPLWRASYQDEKATWGLMDLKEHVVGEVETVAGLALAAVGLVWLIACANASNLLVARVSSRRRELAIRAALGASRLRVVGHLLAESALLATGAAIAGSVLAWAGLRLLREVGSAYLPRTQEIAAGGPVPWVLAALTVASLLLFGLVPAIHGASGPVDHSPGSLDRSSTGAPTARRLRRVLVGTQFAIATPLLIVAALLLASLDELGRVRLGFDTRNLLSGSLSLPSAQYGDPGRPAAFWAELQRRIEGVPGVAGVAFANGRPPNEVNDFNNFDLEQFPTPPGQSQPVTPWVAVTPEYFGLLGLTLIEGRTLDERDALRADDNVVVVDRAWARRFFPDESAVGKRLKGGGCSTCAWTTVVGVVSEVKYAGLDRPDEGTVYTALAPDSRNRFLLVRTTVDPARVLPSLRNAVARLDPSLPFSGAATVDDLVSRSLQGPRSLSLLVGGFATVALLLAVVGIYGVMAYYVQQHAKDIGIRLALGGRPAHVARLVVGQALKVVASGVLLGLLAALFLTRLLSSLLFGVGAADPPTFVSVPFLLLAIAALACFAPARRAIAVQPAAVLRNE